MGKHTPGPWVAHHDELCYYLIETLPGCGGGIGEAYGEANARLIAAAPELLEACKSVARAAVNDRGLKRQELNALLAAIAKAEGTGEQV